MIRRIRMNAREARRRALACGALCPAGCYGERMTFRDGLGFRWQKRREALGQVAEAVIASALLLAAMPEANRALVALAEERGLRSCLRTRNRVADSGRRRSAPAGLDAFAARSER